MKKCIVIINPKSGKGFNKNNISKMDNILDNYNYESTFIFTKYAGHASEIIQSVDYADLVISVGGDGTFSEVMNGNLKRKERLVLAHLPVGTTNDIGAMYGLGISMYTNLKLILTGEIVGVDIGIINKHAFTYVASFGKFMDIPYQTPQELKKMLGYFAYMIEVFKSIFKRTPKYEIDYVVDGEKHTGKYTFIIISNANRIAGINNFYSDIKLDDDKMEVMLCSLRKKRDIIKGFYALKTNKVNHVAGVELYKANSISITFKDKERPWCVDGEKFDGKTNTYKFDLIQDVKMLLPRKNVKKLFLKSSQNS